MEAIESVRAQTFRSWELVIVDDGSTDGTGAAVEAVTDSRIRYIATAHRGVSAARNAGIGITRAPWVCFLDSDDRWTPFKLERQLAVLDAEPEWRAIYTNEIWYRRGRRVNQRKKHQKHSGWIFRHCLPLCIISPSSVMLERRLFAEIGRFDESFQICEDYELWLRLAASHPVRFLDEPLIEKVGGHEDQLSHSTWGLDRFRVRALLKISAQGVLTSQQRIWTAKEIAHKAGILAQGFANRGKLEDAGRYSGLAAAWAESPT
jgi:glycosyltransferase involved in cell wall biosynthesis